MDAQDAMALGLTERARNLLRALDRKDRLETSEEFAGWLQTAVGERDLEEIATELILRAMRVASDPANHRILELLGPLDGVRLVDLMERTGLSRVAVSERVNDLVQTGLASRELIGDQIRGTPLADGFVKLVESLSEAAGRGLAQELGSDPGRAERSDGRG